MQLTARLGSQVWTVSCCDLTFDIMVLIFIMVTRVLFGRSREEVAVKAELNEGLQDWEAGAGNAD